MQPRIDNPAQTVPGAMEALLKLGRATQKAGLPATTHYLVHLRASQINGCSICVDMHSRELKAAGEPDERINTVPAWRETPYFTDAERAAVALTEAVTRLADRPDPVPDDVWYQAARHYEEAQLAALVISIATINTWNRINAATRGGRSGADGAHVEHRQCGDIAIARFRGSERRKRDFTSPRVAKPS